MVLLIELRFFVVEIILDRLGELAHTGRHMSEDQFTKLFTYMQDQFKELRSEMEGMHTDVQHVYEVVDSVLKNQETDQQERLVVSHQLDRHEGWIKQLAKKTETSLSYE
jgi:hypothetical protein